MNDLRHGLRALRAQPAFAMAAMLTIALGIGANTAVFSAIEALLLRPLPYPHSEQLVRIYNSYPKLGEQDSGNTVPDYLDRREQAPALADSALYRRLSFDLADRDPPQRLLGVVATPSLFSTLGVGASLGRTFRTDEAEPGRERVLLLSDALWRGHYGADAGIIGRDVRVSGQSYRVIGVMPPTFSFPGRDVALWVPFTFTEQQKSDAMRGFEFAESIGRLRDGATRAQLEAQFEAILARNLQRLGGPGATGATDFRTRIVDTGFTTRAVGLQQHLTAGVANVLWLLQASVALVLLAACANVANLLLVRLAARQRELGLRAALGATRARLARLLLAESMVLASTGGILGIALAWAGMALIRSLALDGAEQGFAIALDGPVLGFALAAVTFTAIAAGLVPMASLVRGSSWTALNDGARNSSIGRGSTRTRDLLVVLQVAFALALLVGAGLLLRSYRHVQQQDPGFRPEHVVTMNVNLSVNRYPSTASAEPVSTRLMAALRELPGVHSAGIVSGLPFSDDNYAGAYVVEGRDPGAGTLSAYLQVADAGFFRTLEVPLLQGRHFEPGDGPDAPPVAIIDQALARKAFPGRSALGARIAMRNYDGELDWHTIVGVVASVKRHRLNDTGAADTFYFAYSQQPSRIFRIVLKTELPPEALLAPLRATVRAIDPEQPIWDLTTLDQRVERSLEERRTPLLLLSLFAAVALSLCVVGLYGVLAHAVAQRRREIGVRLSLGATSADIRRLVLRDGGRLTGAGLALGTVFVVALAMTPLMRTQLFGVDVLDPLTLVAVAVLVGAVALVASWLPAARAAKTSPAESLRSE